MCDRYSHTKGPQAIRALIRALEDRTGSLPPQPSILPDDLAAVVRCAPDGGRELLTMRWGMPSPQEKSRIAPTIRNAADKWWQPWLREGHRCLVPVTSFCQHDWRSSKPVPTWFAREKSRPAFFFAGIWRPFFGERKREGGEHLVFAFLTSKPNAVVGSLGENSMPVILTSEEAWETWMKGSAKEALRLQRPAPSDALCIVATGNSHDE